MPTSEARILANQANALKSSGPKTSEGKEKSRANALKHGLTGNGVVLVEKDAAEVEYLTAAMTSEMQPASTMGRLLIRRIATLSVRLERSVDQETAALTERIRQVEADFVPPEDVDDASAEKLRLEACRRAMFDPSEAAQLARKYEAAAERGFYRAWKEFRQVEREAKVSQVFVDPVPTPEALGSFFPEETIESVLDSLPPSSPQPPARPASNVAKSAPITSFDLPITIGRAG